MTTELTTRSSAFIERLSQNPIEAVERIGDMLYGSGMFGLKTKEQGRTIAMVALCQGRNPFEVIGEYHVMGDGKLTMKADAMLAHFLERGGRVDWTRYEDAGVEGKFTSSNGSSITISIAWDDAKRKGWVTKTYEKYPRQMLKARAISEGIRAIDPGCIVGIYTPEEMDAVIIESEPVKQMEQAQKAEPAKTLPAQSSGDREKKVIEFFSKYKICIEPIESKFGKPPWSDSSFDAVNKLRAEMAKLSDAVAKKSMAEEFFNISDAVMPDDTIL